MPMSRITGHFRDTVGDFKCIRGEVRASSENLATGICTFCCADTSELQASTAWRDDSLPGETGARVANYYRENL